jgi:hypothetical protein
LNLSAAVLATLTGSSQGTNAGRVVIVFNPILGSTAVQPAWAAVYTDSIVDIDTTVSTQISGGTEIQQLSTGGNSAQTIDMTSFPFAFQYGDIITVAAQSRAGTMDFNGSVTWFEDR